MRSGDLKRHKANVHDIDAKWSKCDQCGFKSKMNGYLKVHKANIHGIDVKWFKCDQCDAKYKENGTLKKTKLANIKNCSGLFSKSESFCIYFLEASADLVHGQTETTNTSTN